MRYVAIAIALFIILCTLIWGVGGFISLSWNVLLWNGVARFGLVFFWFIVALPLSIMLTVGVHEMDEEKAKKARLKDK
ncbi:hypothetical protein Kassivere_00092 [Pseudomonas phage vB_PpuM-Kassivere]